MINVAIVDDHKVLIQGVEALLEQFEDVSVSWTENSGEACIDKCKFDAPDVLLLDVSMRKGMNGFETVQKLRENDYPGKVILLTMHNEYGYIQKGVEAGADGYLLKDTGKNELYKAITSVHDGATFFGKEVSSILINGLRPKDMDTTPIEVKLTAREKEILEHIAQELTTEEIAKKLHLITPTVESHRKKLLQKCQAKNTVGLVKYALKAGLVS